MKATLESRKSVRLNWFKLEDIPVIKQRSMDWSYTLYNIGDNEISHTMNYQFIFNGITQPIPKTNIIIFEKELPQSYTKTDGNIGEKLLTQKTEDYDVKCTDRIVKLDQGEEKITTKPVLPHETQMYKEIQIRERTDTIHRKITIKNNSENPINAMEIVFIETKEIRFIESSIAPTTTDAPEYKWNFEIPPTESISFEIVLESYTKETYKIEREHEKGLKISYPSMDQRILNNKDDEE
jgi:hypothetical protein